MNLDAIEVALIMVAMGYCDDDATIAKAIGEFFELGDAFVNLGFGRV
jgi:hypothetical protein